MDLLKKLTDEFIVIYEKSPARLKSKLTSIKALAEGASNRQGQVKENKTDQDWKVSNMMNMKMYHPAEKGVNGGIQSQSSSSQYSNQQQTGGSLTQPMLPLPPHQSQQMHQPDLYSGPPFVPPQYGCNSLQMLAVNGTGSQLSTKLDTMHDITRNMMHSSRAGYNNAPPPPPPTANSPAGPILTYHRQHAASSLISNNYNKIEIMLNSEEPSHPVNQYKIHKLKYKLLNGFFSPDWSDKHQGQKQEQQMQQPPQSHYLQGSGLNRYVSNTAIGSFKQNSKNYAAGGYKILSNSLHNKDSPLKIKIERDTASKKDKSHSSTSIQDNGRPVVGHVPQQMLKTTIPKKLDTSLSSTLAALNELSGTSSMGTVSGGGIKRPNELITIKQEDDLLVRDSKIRKLDTASGNSAINKHQVVNGIETNTDMVRNLLRESLCSTSSLLKTEPSIVTPSLQPPATTSSSTTQHNTSITSISNNNVMLGNSDVSAMEIDEHDTSGIKSEKKKKKNKQKNKENDKSKDRKERKKHKKDKDRH